MFVEGERERGREKERKKEREREREIEELVDLIYGFTNCQTGPADDLQGPGPALGM